MLEHHQNKDDSPFSTTSLSYLWMQCAYSSCRASCAFVQDLLTSLALQEGCMKAGQRYWAHFALRQVASKLSGESMAALLASDDVNGPQVEEGALLLVRNLTHSGPAMLPVY